MVGFLNALQEFLTKLEDIDFQYEFQPFKEITRAEALKIVFQGFNIVVPEKARDIPFSDVSTKDWYAPYVSAAAKAKIIKGYGDGTFQPNESIRRSEAIKIILMIAGIGVQNANLDLLNTVDDISKDAWYAPYVATAIENRILPKDMKEFKANDYITRFDLVKYKNYACRYLKIVWLVPFWVSIGFCSTEFCETDSGFLTWFSLALDDKCFRKQSILNLKWREV